MDDEHRRRRSPNRKKQLPETAKVRKLVALGKNCGNRLIFWCRRIRLGCMTVADENLT